LRAVPSAGRLTAGPAVIDAGTAEHRRARRLLAVLDDVAQYTAGNTSTDMLAQAWDRILDLLGDSPDLHLRAALRAVGEQVVGSPGWWRSIRTVASMLDEGRPQLASGGG